MMSTTANHCFAILLLTATCVGEVASAASSYSIVPVGLVDAEHTRDDGYQLSTPRWELNEAGYVIGTSARYNGGSTNLGRSAWIFDGATTTDIGLADSEHTRSDGYRSSFVAHLNEAGQAIGQSNRYNGAAFSEGVTTWFYDGTTTIRIGLIGGEYTRSDGYQSSDHRSLNEAGQVVGWSDRFNGAESFGQTSWVYSNGTLKVIGLIDDEHTRSSGYRYSEPWWQNATGQVIGTSDRYDSNNLGIGRSAWFYNGESTVEIGLTGDEFTSSNGTRSSRPDILNSQGQVGGRSTQYNGGFIPLGHSAWIFDGIATVEVGFSDIEHTRFDGTTSQDVYLLNDAGMATGVSGRFNGGNSDLGISAWFYNGTDTFNIGLTGPEYTRDDGYKRSTNFRLLNESGIAGGISERFNGGSASMGQTAWRYDGASTTEIGLSDGKYVRDDGYKFGDALMMNEAGQIAGYSERYVGNSQGGQDAWIYDPALDQSIALNLSTRQDGYAYSEIFYLGEDGVVLGTYTLFDSMDNDLGSRGFYFTVAEGLHDLGMLVDEGLAANGWDTLADAVRANRVGQILGHGNPQSPVGSQLAYVLTPTVPEPTTVSLGILACMTMCAPICRLNRDRHLRASS